jgi:hypothetical protein
MSATLMSSQGLSSWVLVLQIPGHVQKHINMSAITMRQRHNLGPVLPILRTLPLSGRQGE